MTVEYLFPELCNLYGDSANIRYLRQCKKEETFIGTYNTGKPEFVDKKVDMLYLGSMTGSQQILAVKRLEPYKERLRELIAGGTVILATGNAVELFGTHIEDAGETIPMLGLYDFHAVRDRAHRHNSMFLGEFEGLGIVGAKSQFSFLYGDFPHSFIKVNGGYGNNPFDKNEGFRDNNLFATYLLGPFLVQNPHFTKYLLRLMGEDDTLAFEDDVFEAYNFRKENLEKEGVNFLVGHHG